MTRHSYIWQKIDLKQVVWQEAQFASLLAEIHLLRGTLLGKLSLLGFKMQDDTRLEALAREIIHSSVFIVQQPNIQFSSCKYFKL